MDPLLRLTLRQGTVYYMEHRNLTSREPHYFVVVNREPFADKVLLMAVSTSKVERSERRRLRSNMPEKTLVKISPSEYREFTKESCIDCNKLFTRSLEELTQLRLSKQVKDMKDIPKSVLIRIIEGILASPQISEAEKKWVKGLHL